MKKYYNTTLGFYESPFFRLHLATHSGDVFDINTVSHSDFSVFIHEYIHFLQAITTFYGLNHIHITVEYFKKVLNIIYPTDNQFKVPNPPDIFPQDNVYFNWRIFKLTQGDDADSISNVKIIKAIDPIEDEIDDKCVVQKIRNVMLTVEDFNGEENPYIFGAVCIMESMAYMLEQYLSPKGVQKSPDLPYNSAMLVAQAIHPDFAKDQLNILALCDLSLQSSNPGNFFVETLVEWKNTNKIPKNPDELYEYFYNLEWGVAGKKEKQALIDSLQEMVKLSEDQLYEYFKPDDDDPHGVWSQRMNILRQWINAILNSAMNWRANHKTFVLDMARGGTGKTNKVFKEIFDDFGIPFCTNKSGHAFIFHKIAKPHRLDLDYFAAISQIFDTLQGRFKQCELFELCKLSGKPFDDALCKIPWLMYQTTTNSCPYAIIWRHWKLDGHIPVKS